MGLGLLGGALNDAKFLLECGAVLTITDLKSAEELKIPINKLKKWKNIKYVLGYHDLEDFKIADFILQPGNVPPDSVYLQEARKNNIPIHESESLFMNFVEDVTVIGVTGTRGKTTTTCLIYEILKSVFDKKVHLGGNVKGTSTLSLLKKVHPKDIVVAELDSWCLHGIGKTGKSPQISVFTNFMPDHLNYYLKGSRNEEEAKQKYFDDKAQIYLNQKKENFLICGDKISEKIGYVKSNKIVTNKNDVPKNWKLKVKGEHNLENIACAIAVARVLKVDEKIIKKAVENFSGVEGRLQFIKEYKGIKIYNDTTSTTPDATIVALKSLGRGSTLTKNIVLIVGGADKNLNMSGLLKEIPKYCKSLILLPGTGTDKLGISNLEYGKWNKYKIQNSIFNIRTTLAKDLNEATEFALDNAKHGDILLFSPAFASFGMFKNEFDRGNKFIKIINNL